MTNCVTVTITQELATFEVESVTLTDSQGNRLPDKVPAGTKLKLSAVVKNTSTIDGVVTATPTINGSLQVNANKNHAIEAGHTHTFSWEIDTSTWYQGRDTTYTLCVEVSPVD